MASLGVTRPEEFMTVAYIHNASYLGGMLGMVVVWCCSSGSREEARRGLKESPPERLG